MNLIVFLIVGGIVGWLASLIMKTDGSQGIVLNVVVGIVGALLAGWLLTPLLGIAPITTASALSIPAILVSLLGAVLLLAIINLVRRGSISNSPG
jgi:uncharacterized membrane protein YeaQ/YmgE (transglycosylase-associated protein family)